MSCYHPLNAILIGIKPNGKKDFKFCKNKREAELAKMEGKLIKVNCGKCIGCRLQNASNNADQMVLETKCHKSNITIHLTYDDENVPTNKIIDMETGEVLETKTLKVKDTQDFMKKLRQAINRRYKRKIEIRFSLCGEYGETRKRPHYHAIIYGWEPDDKIYWGKSKSGYDIYISPFLSKVWGKGIVKVNEVTREMAEYIGRYVTKKWKGPNSKEYYESQGKEPEFYHCSNRPGIGYEYYAKNKDTIYKTDEIFIQTYKGTKQKKPPKYFDKLLERESLPTIQEIKEKRKETAEQRLQKMLSITGWTEEEYLEMQEQARKDKIKALKRNDESQKIIIDAYGRRKYL